MLQRIGVLAAVLATACYAPTVTPNLPCGEGEACPFGLTCDRGLCVSSPAPLDAATDGAADADAAPDGMPGPPAWIEATPLPAGRSIGCVVAHAKRLYFIGGSLASTARADVWRADIRDDGTLGSWTATTSLPVANRWHACAVDPVHGAIYTTGGDAGDAGVNARTVVYRAPVNLDGTLGAWVAQTELPSPRRGHGTWIYQGYLYVIGGEEKDGFEVRDHVYAVAIGAAGTVGGWSTSTNKLPAPDYMFGTAVAGDRVYVTGGYAGHDAVYGTSLGANGANAAFVAATMLPAPRERHVSASDGDEVFVFGGEQSFGGSNLDTALRAPIIPGGGLGAWTALPPAPYAIAYATAAFWNGRMYVAGGSEDTGVSARVLVLGPL